jgi:hypothetical protein
MACAPTTREIRDRPAACVYLRLKAPRQPTLRFAGFYFQALRLSAVRDGDSSGRSALVSMVQAANRRERDDATGFRSLHRPWLRSVLVQSEMRST